MHLSCLSPSNIDPRKQTKRKNTVAMHSFIHPPMHPRQPCLVDHPRMYARIASPHASNARPYLLSSFETVGDLKTGPIHTHKHLQTRQEDSSYQVWSQRETERGRDRHSASKFPVKAYNVSCLSNETFLRSFVLTSPSHSPIHPPIHPSIRPLTQRSTRQQHGLHHITHIARQPASQAPHTDFARTTIQNVQMDQSLSTAKNGSHVMDGMCYAICAVLCCPVLRVGLGVDIYCRV